MIDFLNPYKWLLALGLALSMWGWHAWDKHRAVEGAVQDVRDAYTAQALKASEAARAKEKELQAKVKGVTDAYIVERRKRVADGVATQSELDRLRDELALSGAASQNPGTASGVYGAGGPERDLLGACATHLVRLAGEADRLESKVIGLQEYVKAVLQDSGKAVCK